MNASAAKIDSARNLIWNTFLGSNQNDEREYQGGRSTPFLTSGEGGDAAFGVALDGSGNIFLTGVSNKTWGTPTIAHGAGGDEGFLAKLDNNGTLQWMTFSGKENSFSTGITTDGKGGIYIAGRARDDKLRTLYFPQLADGGGYSTSVILLNTSSNVESGTLRLYADNGSAFTARQTGGTTGSLFSYSIQPNGAFVFQTDSSQKDTKTGWAELIPDGGTRTPIAAGLFEYSPGGVLVTESGIPSTGSTNYVRIFVDTTSGHDTGFGIGNPGSAPLNVTLTAYQMDGLTAVGAGPARLLLETKGHTAAFVGQLLSGLPSGFRGVLDLKSETPFAALTIRSLVNERGDYLITTFPVADMNRSAPSPIVFPQIADGGGYVTEIILLGSEQACQTTIKFYGDTGVPLAIGK
jgi:hypothetical protein